MWTLETRFHQRLVWCEQCPSDGDVIAVAVTAHNKAMKHARKKLGHRVWVVDLVALEPEHVYRYEQIQLGDDPPF